MGSKYRKIKYIWQDETRPLDKMGTRQNAEMGIVLENKIGTKELSLNTCASSR
jgi:hypothetical protein